VKAVQHRHVGEKKADRGPADLRVAAVISPPERIPARPASQYRFAEKDDIFLFTLRTSGPGGIRRKCAVSLTAGPVAERPEPVLLADQLQIGSSGAEQRSAGEQWS